nr:hypothetical protein [Staphylococcus capitis]
MVVIGRREVNGLGIGLSILFGGVKMMMGNMVKYRVIMVVIVMTGAL